MLLELGKRLVYLELWLTMEVEYSWLGVTNIVANDIDLLRVL